MRKILRAAADDDGAVDGLDARSVEVYSDSADAFILFGQDAAHSVGALGVAVVHEALLTIAQSDQLVGNMLGVGRQISRGCRQ